MPTCHKCTKEFSNRIIIDGKVKLLSKRKYCLECSPWGLHNTISLETEQHGVIECTCQTCNRHYIYNPNRKNGFTKTHCNSCLVNRRRFELKLRAIKYKGSCCEKCGYSTNASALVFHHLNPLLKDFNIGGNHCHSWTKIKNELDKCIMLCHNCHTELHYPDNMLAIINDNIYYQYNKYDLTSDNLTEK